MVGRDRFVRATSGMVALLLGACSGDGSESTPSAPSTPPATSYVVAPTAEQLAAALITPDDYAGTWSVNVPSSAEYAIDGVVSDEQQAMLPKIAFCDKADEKSRSAAAGLRWRGFRQIDQSEADPIDPARGDRVGHMIFVQEFLTAGDPADIESMFNALRDGMRACEGPLPAGEEGPGEARPFAITAVGDDRYGALTTVEEAGGGAYWLLYSSLVRQGPVLMELQVVDIVMGEQTEPAFTAEDIDTFLVTAVEKLPSTG